MDPCVKHLLELVNTDDVVKAANDLVSYVRQILDNHAPLVESRPLQNSSSWATRELKKLINARNNLKRKIGSGNFGNDCLITLRNLQRESLKLSKFLKREYEKKGS